jgi:hypothetical protein
MAVRDQAVLSEIQYAVIEPPDGGASWPSGLWTRDEVLGALNQRQDRLLRESLLLVGVATIQVSQFDGAAEVDLPDAVVNGEGVIQLPADWLATFAVVWRGTDGTVRDLLRTDTFEADHYDQAWAGESGTPLFYLDHDLGNRFMRIAPYPLVDSAGTIELWYIPLGAPMNGAEILTVPDELAPTLKYGVLADLLGKDGRARDPIRAEYCEQRFQMGIEAATLILDGFA